MNDIDMLRLKELMDNPEKAQEPFKIPIITGLSDELKEQIEEMNKQTEEDIPKVYEQSIENEIEVPGESIPRVQYPDTFEDKLSEMLKELGYSIHVDNLNKGFWANPNLSEKIALIHSEVSELLEATRKETIERSEHIPEFYAFEEEIADIIIRTLDLADRYGSRVGPAIFAKLEYNRNRPHKHGKKF